MGGRGGEGIQVPLQGCPRLAFLSAGAAVRSAWTDFNELSVLRVSPTLHSFQTVNWMNATSHLSFYTSHVISLFFVKKRFLQPKIEYWNNHSYDLTIAILDRKDGQRGLNYIECDTIVYWRTILLASSKDMHRPFSSILYACSNYPVIPTYILLSSFKSNMYIGFPFL